MTDELELTAPCVVLIVSGGRIRNRSGRGLCTAAGRRIPTAIMSGSLGRSSASMATIHGFTFFAKPVDPEQLRTWLSAAIVATAPD